MQINDGVNQDMVWENFAKNIFKNSWKLIDWNSYLPESKNWKKYVKETGSDLDFLNRHISNPYSESTPCF